MRAQSVQAWAYEEFGDTELGDSRRERRLLRMAAGAAAQPAGRVSEVFQVAAERQGAYDLLENDEVRCDALAKAMFRATARRASGGYAFVAVDGSSLTLTDRMRAKDFGGIGATDRGARGLKVISAYALDFRGIPLGILDQQWWARPPHKRRSDHQKRPLEEKETQHWVSCIRGASEQLQAQGHVRPWFVIDREGDCLDMLNAIEDSRALFTIRSRHDRRLEAPRGQRLYLVPELQSQPAVGLNWVHVPGGHRRTERKARLEVRVARKRLRLRDRITDRVSHFEVGCVEAREVGTVPKGEKPLEWRLLTNAPLASLQDAINVIFSYVQRWKIEDFHRAWKSGVCNIERCQLRRKNHVVKWATIMAAVAARIERLKLRSRSEPELPADCELGEYEISALILLKRRQKKRTETISDDMPTLAQAVLWLAELGGYTGKSSGGPPGSTTIRRGLEFIAPAVATIKELETMGKLR